MRKGFKYLLFGVCLSGVSIGYAAQTTDNDNPSNNPTANSVNATQQDGFSNPSKPIYVQRNAPQFTLRLQSNPSTGYSWFLEKCDQDLIQVISHKFYSSQSQKIGASGYEEWVFKATPAALIVPRITYITLMYVRPWEADHRQNPTRFTIVIKN
jgi:predicted secreted protein